MFKNYFDLIKIGIVIFVLLSGVAGYATSFFIERPFELIHFFYLVIGLFFLSSGSLALNQVQEWRLDQKMVRTNKRPIASGKLTPTQGFFVALSHLILGSYLLFQCSLLAFIFGLLTVFLYNGIYVYIWKKKWVFGAVPGAIPGALPVTIGYAANDSNWYHGDSIYLFLILFLWQIPHFWILAIKYKEDYAKGNFPVLPVALGVSKTLSQIVGYTFVYLGVAIAAPLFLRTSWSFLWFIIPIVMMILFFLRHYINSHGEKWLGLFLGLNFSMLAFLFIPAIDKWKHLFIAFQ